MTTPEVLPVRGVSASLDQSHDQVNPRPHQLERHEDDENIVVLSMGDNADEGLDGLSQFSEARPSLLYNEAPPFFSVRVIALSWSSLFSDLVCRESVKQCDMASFDGPALPEQDDGQRPRTSQQLGH